MTVRFPKGSSRIEPGTVPASDLEYTFKTWTQFEKDCGLSRVYGGVHFRDSVQVITEMGHTIANLNNDLVQSHISYSKEPPVSDTFPYDSNLVQ